MAGTLENWCCGSMVSFSFGLFQVNQPFVFGSVSTDTPLSVMGVNFGGFADVAT